MEHQIRPKVFAVQGFAGNRTTIGQQALPQLARKIAQALDRSDMVACRMSMETVETLAHVLEASRTNLEAAARMVAEGMNETAPLVLLMARCATAIATIPQVLSRYPDAILLWFDAHGDLNTPETSGTGYLGGMPLAAVLGLWESGYGHGLNSGQLCLIGARDLDPAEERLIERHDILHLRDPSRIVQLDRLKELIQGRPVYVHLDLDVLEPGLIETEYSVPGGLTVDEVQEILATVSWNGKFIGIEIAEFDSTEDGNISIAAQVIVQMLRGLHRADLAHR